MTSCGVSNSVVNDGIVQKRKYSSGWYVKSKSKVAEVKNVSFKETDFVKNISFEIQLHDEMKRIDQIGDDEGYIEASGIYENEQSDSLSNIAPVLNTNRQNLQVQEFIRVIETSFPKVSFSAIRNDKDPSEEINKPASYSFALFLLSILFGAIAIAGNSVELLLLAFLIFVISIILATIALTKYKDREKRKIFAKIVLYTILASLVLAIVWIIYVASGSYTFKN